MTSKPATRACPGTPVGAGRGRLLAAVVVIETVVVLIALCYLRGRYTLLLDEHLYAIHLAGDGDFFRDAMQEALAVVVVMLAMNFPALVLADTLWGRGARGPSGACCVPDDDGRAPLGAWRVREADRCRQVAAALESVQSSDTSDPRQKLAATQRAIALLTAPSRGSG